MPDNVDSYEALDTDATGQYESPINLTPSNAHRWREFALCGREEYQQEVSEDGTVTPLQWCGERAAPRPAEKRICWEECPVRRHCLTWAITQAEKHCIYGGYNFGQRRLIWRRWVDEGVLPDIPRTRINPAEVLRVMTEASISTYGDMPGTIDLSDPDSIYEYGEPPLKDLLAIEAEES